MGCGVRVLTAITLAPHPTPAKCTLVQAGKSGGAFGSVRAALQLGVWSVLLALVSTTFRVAYAADPVRHLTLKILPGQRFLPRTANIQLLEHMFILLLWQDSAEAIRETRLTPRARSAGACGGF